jgi:hypothetical protein
MDGTKAATRSIWPVIIWLESKERLLDLPRLFTGPSPPPPPYVRGLFCQKENPLALSIVPSDYYSIFRVLLLRLWHLVHMLWNFPYRSPLFNKAACTFSSNKIAIVSVHISIDALSLRRLPE